MLRSANFTIWLVELGLMSAAETALKLEASAPSIAVAIRPRRPVVAIKVFMVVSRMVDKGRSGCSTGCGQCEAVGASYLRCHANRISCLTDEDTVRGSNPTSGVEIPRRRHSNDDPRPTSNLMFFRNRGGDWIERVTRCLPLHRCGLRCALRHAIYWRTPPPCKVLRCHRSCGPVSLVIIEP